MITNNVNLESLLKLSQNAKTYLLGSSRLASPLSSFLIDTHSIYNMLGGNGYDETLTFGTIVVSDLVTNVQTKLGDLGVSLTELLRFANFSAAKPTEDGVIYEPIIINAEHSVSGDNVTFKYFDGTNVPADSTIVGLIHVIVPIHKEGEE